MGAALCFALSGIYFLVWSRNRSNRAHLLFAVTAAAFGAYGFVELRLLLAPTPERWTTCCGGPAADVGCAAVADVVCRHVLDAGRRWFAWTICGVRAVFALPNWSWAGIPTLLEIPKLEHIQFAGESVAIIKASPIRGH